MNKRQKKKAFKKKFGYNPRITDVQNNYRYLEKRLKKAINSMGEAMRNAIPIIKNAIDSIRRLSHEVTEHIKTMPEEDFNNILDSPELDESVKAWAKQIRKNGKEYCDADID